MMLRLSPVQTLVVALVAWLPMLAGAQALGTLVLDLKTTDENTFLVPFGDTLAVDCSDGVNTISGTGFYLQSSVTITNAADGACYICTGTGLTNHAQSGVAYGCATGGSTTNLDFYVVSLDATTTISILDSGDDSPVTLQTGDSVSVSCQTSDGLVKVSKAFSVSSSNVVMQLPDLEVLECSFTKSSSLSGYALGGSTYLFTNGTSAASLFATQLDGTITLQLSAAVPSGSSAVAECDGAGYNFLASVSDGATQVSIPVVKGYYYQCKLSGLNSAIVQPDYVYVGSSGSATLNLTLAILDASITVSLQDISGATLTVPDGTPATASCYGAVNISATVAPGLSSIVLDVQSGGFYYCDATIEGFISAGGASIDLASSTSGSAQVKFYEPDATLVVNLLDSAGTTYTVPSGSYGSASCSGTNGSFYFSIPAGESSASSPIVSGTYSCTAYVPDLASTTTDVTVQTGTTGSVNVSLFPKPFNVTVAIRDSSGSTIDVNGSAGCYTVGGSKSDYSYVSVSSGTGTFKALAADYSCYFSSSGGSAAGGSSDIYGIIKDNSSNSYILGPAPTESISGSSQTIVLTAYRADAQINVTVTGGSAESYVSAVQDGANGVVVSGLTQAGVIALPVPAGTYQVSAYGPGLSPLPQSVTVAASATASVTLAFLEVDYTLTVSGSASDGASGEYNCSMYAPDEGVTAFSQQAALGAAVTLGISKSIKTWLLSCYGYGQNSGGTTQVYLSEFTPYLPKSKQSSDSVAVSLVESAEMINQSFTITNSLGGTFGFTTADGTEIEIVVPQSAFDTNSSEVQVVVSNIPDTATSTSTGELTALPGLILSINAFDSSGNAVALADGKTILLKIALSVPDAFDDDTVKYVETNDVTGASNVLDTTELSDTTEAAQLGSGPDTQGANARRRFATTIRAISNTVSSRYRMSAASLDTTTAPSAVTGVKVKQTVKKGKLSRKVTWTASENAVTYRVRVLKGSKVVATKSGITSATYKIKKKLIKGTKYKVKVYAVGVSTELESGAVTKSFKAK